MDVLKDVGVATFSVTETSALISQMVRWNSDTVWNDFRAKPWNIWSWRGRLGLAGSGPGGVGWRQFSFRRRVASANSLNTQWLSRTKLWTSYTIPLCVKCQNNVNREFLARLKQPELLQSPRQSDSKTSDRRLAQHTLRLCSEISSVEYLYDQKIVH